MDTVEFDSLLHDVYAVADATGFSRVVTRISEALAATLAVALLRPDGAPAQVLAGPAQAAAPIWADFELKPETLRPATTPSARAPRHLAEVRRPGSDGDLHVLGADIHLARGDVLALRFARPVERGPFSSQALALGDRLAAHLGAAFDLVRRRRYELMVRSTQSDMLNTLCLGALVIDGAGRVLEQNYVAKDILAQRDGLLVNQGVLSAYDPAAANRLRNAIAAVQADPGVTQIVQAPRRTGGPSYGLMVRAAQPMEDSWLAPRLAMVLVGDPLVAPAPELDSVAKFFGFTHSEAALSVLLADGLTLDEAADQLGVSRNTAKTHLRAVYQKTGVTRQSQLVRYIYASIAGLWRLEAGDEIPRRALDL